MRNNILSITRKELARFFSNKVSAIIAIVLPGLLIYAMWSLMGTAISDMGRVDEEKHISIAAINLPQSLEALRDDDGLDVKNLTELPSPEEMREAIKKGEYLALVVFPEKFDTQVDEYLPASGGTAPQIEIYYDSTKVDSSYAYNFMTALLNNYESSLANRFDINSGDTTYDVSDERSRTSVFIVSIVPMVLLILLFSGCMSVAAESIAGEKERGTMTTLLATPIKRSDIAFGKVLALTLIGLMIAASSAIGIFASLPNLFEGSVDINMYGPAEYSLLALVILSTTLLIVMMITIVSALAKTTKEAQIYLTPLMIVVLAVGLVGMFGEGAQTDMAYYFIPLYNSVQCMIGIFTFEFQPVNVFVSVVANLIYTGIGVAVLQQMFKSERLMFAR